MRLRKKTATLPRDWVATAPVYSHGKEAEMLFVVCNDLPTLVWLGNLADLEFHTNLSLAADFLTPTMMVYDLDPGPPASIVECCQVALWIRELFLNADTTSASTSSTATRRWCAADLMCAASAPTSIRGAYSAAG